MQSRYRFPPVPPAFWGRALWPVVVGIFAAGLVLLRQTEFGPGLTADSAIYVATGRNLFAGEGFVSVFGPFERYPPLYPLVIAATGFLHDDMIASAAVLNAVAFGLSVSATAAWLQTRQASAFLVVWVGLALALSPLASAATYVWSESVFVLFALLALFALDRFLVADTRRALLLSAVAAALCCLTRYAGAAVIACAVLLIALRRSWQPTRRLRAVVVYTAVGLAPTAVWMARNVFVVGSLMGDRTQFHGSPLGTSHMAVEMSLALAVGPAVFDWIEAFSAGGGTRDATIADLRWKSTWLLGVWVLVVCGLACGRRPGLWRDVSVPAGFLLCYFAVLAVAPVGGGTIAEPRFVVPIIAPMLVVFALTLHSCHARASLTTADWSGRRAPGGWGRGAWGRWPIPALASLWLAQWVAPNAAEIKQWLTHGGDGYGARRWAESDTVAHLKSATVGDRLLSNDPMAVYLLVGGGTATHLSGYHRIDGIPPEIPHGVHVVWFYDSNSAGPADLMAFLNSFPKMELVAAHDDGVLFQQGVEENGDDAPTRLAEMLLRSARNGQLVVASGFNVSLDSADNRLTYVKHGCESTDVRPRFFLHVDPQDPAELPSGNTWAIHDHEQPGWGMWRPFLAGFHNLDFSFAPRGVRQGGACLATKALPSYAIAEVRTGQWSQRGALWSARFVTTPVPTDRDRN